MATSNLVDSTLTVSFDGGIDTDGKSVVMTKRFTGIKIGAQDDQLFAIIEALAPLQSYPVLTVKRDNTIDITA
ncbi:DUF1659 domain-containing protein [Pullulanibacillus sp. KACC 23026]|uniref:DUF1659 domain-containing protein n=1 Tax=Pullulanibacillus sp. KACC 23026 TaxID=3028315 RepID=UPI0023AF5A27|nr:DUF1659 domain-containing protein [Pullulanibacillus sp. KACC 23026]WEG11942.1 DUF1659 domain-containing protein [Pullulanibacillus sp. KACC 23026]